MAITIEQLDRKIKNLTLLRELASDPECLALMKELASANDSSGTDSAAESERNHIRHHAKKTTKGTSKRSLMTAVFSAIEAMNGTPFTVYELTKRMIAASYSFNAADPAIAVNGVVRRIVKRGQTLDIYRRGLGSSPTYYQSKHTVEDSA